jgi:hypothetical protein
MVPQKTNSNQKRGAKETRYPLKNIPEDVYKILWREQAKLKTKKGVSQFSLASTIYHIVKEYDKIKPKEGEA